MRKSCDTLHLDRVHFLEWVVEDPRGIDDLPSQVLVVEVTNEKRLGRKRVRLYVYVRTCDLVDEGRLSDVGIPADKQSPRVGVNRGKTGHMLPDLLEVSEGILLPPHYRRHTGVTREVSETRLI